jgi:hypothetical protein
VHALTPEDVLASKADRLGRAKAFFTLAEELGIVEQARA